MGIHNYDRNIEAALDRLKRAKIAKANYGFIIDYYNYLCARGMSKARINRYLQTLKLFGELSRKNFKRMEKKDLIALVGVIESRDYTNWTKMTYKSMLKKFFMWLHDLEEPNDLVKWIKVSCKNIKRMPSELLTQDEVKQLIIVCKNYRNRALVSMLYETGCRIGELGNLLIKHVSFDKYGGILMVDGKTGQRRVRIISSVPYLAQWLDNHPVRRPDAPLWASLPPNDGRQLDYASICRIIRVLAKRAGITKRVNPHSFRHARATHLANKLTEAQMKEYFGWVQGSDMASVYIHLSGRDVDNALLRINGIEVEETKTEDSMSLINCTRCNHSNAPTSTYCNKCGMLLDIKEAMDLERVNREKDEVMKLILSDPEIKKLAIERLKVRQNG